MTDKKNILKIIIIIGLIIFIAYNFILPKNTGYCKLEGTYGNRYVKCYGDYSPRAKSRAEKKAKQCNRSINPISGCTSTYR